MPQSAQGKVMMVVVVVGTLRWGLQEWRWRGRLVVLAAAVDGRVPGGGRAGGGGRRRRRRRGQVEPLLLVTLIRSA